MPQAVVFETQQLTKVYGEGELAVHALRGIDLQLLAGEMVVLLGASGSGKSTLLNILGGLDHATSGTVHYGELDLSQATERQLTEYRRHHVGFVFQFYNLIASLTAEENVAVATEIVSEPMAPRDALARFFALRVLVSMWHAMNCRRRKCASPFLLHQARRVLLNWWISARRYPAPCCNACARARAW